MVGQGAPRSLVSSRPLPSQEPTLPFRLASPAALKHLQDETVPWQRVLSSTGQISSRGDGGPGAERQREALEAEGVEVTGRPGELGRVKLNDWGWFPETVELEGVVDDED